MCRHEGHVRTRGEDGRRLAEERSLGRSPPARTWPSRPASGTQDDAQLPCKRLGLRHVATAALLCPLPSAQEARVAARVVNHPS